jgi:hypothetical protein
VPIVNTSQARIELSRKQVESIIEVYAETSDSTPMFWIEETNIPSAVAVGGRNVPDTIVSFQGTRLVLDIDGS